MKNLINYMVREGSQCITSWGTFWSWRRLRSWWALL